MSRGDPFLSRRDMLFRASAGFGGLALSALMADDRLSKTDPMLVRAPHFEPKAKSVIFLFMDGGVSQVDTFDPKPKLYELDGKSLPFDEKVNARNDEKTLWGSPFKFAKHGQCGADVSELFPHLATCVDSMTIIRSMFADQTEHTAGNYQMHSGFAIQGRPSMGAWITYGLGSSCKNLPGFVVIDTGMIPPGGFDLFGSGFLPASYQGMLFRKGKHPVADIAPREPDPAMQIGKIDFIRDLDRGVTQRYGPVSEIEAAIANYELAFRMQSEVPDLLDFAKESEATRGLYGIGEADTDEFGRACLVARRMVERGVRFIELLSPRRQGVDRWDQHGSLVRGHGLNCRATDKPMAALIKDLRARGLLESTLLVWGGEFGRTPTRQGTADRGFGRDHHPFGFTMWMAGGGVKGGLVHGATDDFGYFAVEKKVHVHDLHATILHLLGLDHKRLTYPFGGRQMRLTDVHGNVVNDVLA
jgi:hypothetical protein